jgi:hypothetical protein
MPGLARIERGDRRQLNGIGKKRLIPLSAFFLILSGLGARPNASASWAQASQEKKEEKPEVQVPALKGRRLMLKDGSYHLVRSYERKGDRVRFYSIERSAWEEVPAELVDWEATSKAEAEDRRRKEEILEKVQAIQTAERAEEVDVDASIEIAPGIFLPEGEGLYLLDEHALVALSQVSTELKLDKGRLLTQVLVPVPVIPTRHKVQIAGKRAQLRVSTASPEFYMRTADQHEPELELIRAEVKGDVRQVELISTHITGQQTSQRKTVSVQRWQLAKGVYRLTTSQQLEPGEYVLTEILPEGQTAIYVWDFGVDQASARPAKKQ